MEHNGFDDIKKVAFPISNFVFLEGVRHVTFGGWHNYWDKLVVNPVQHTKCIISSKDTHNDGTKKMGTCKI